MTYYNELDPKAAAWLRELIAGGLIPIGEVDTRSITDVTPDDLSGFAQCHFFAGIGGWAYALKLAGWDDDRPVWTGSCPCQPFSQAGKGLGTADARHLWPVFERLIAKCSPPVVFGEQVAGALGVEWMDRVAADLEGSGYAVGAAILPACGYGADHERKRIFWVANACGEGRERLEQGTGLSCREGAALPLTCDSFTVTRRAMAGDFSGLLQRDGVSVQLERDAIKGYGNAIVPQVAAEFIQAFTG